MYSVMRRIKILKLQACACLIGLLTFVSPQSANAADLLTTLGSGTCSNYGFNSTWKAFQPFTIPSSATITAVNFKAYNSDPTPMIVKIYADNSSSPSSTILGTFTFASTSNYVGRFTGNVTLSSAGKYWLYLSATSQVYACFSYTPVTTGSLPNWTISRVFEGGISATAATRSDDGVFHFTFEGSGGVLQTNSSVSLTSASSIPFRSSLLLTANLGVAGSDGKVTFFANGKRIAGCISKPSSSLAATCAWKPSIRGSYWISAKLVPTNSTYLSSTSSLKLVAVTNRTSAR